MEDSDFKVVAWAQDDGNGDEPDDNDANKYMARAGAAFEWLDRLNRRLGQFHNGEAGNGG